LSLNYLIDSYLDSQDEVVTGEDDNGKYEKCNGCNQKIYECDHTLPLEYSCSKCMYGEQEEQDWFAHYVKKKPLLKI